MKYRKRPVVIDAFKLGTDSFPDWFSDKVTDRTVTLRGTSDGFYDGHDVNADVKTLEGVMHANYGDYVIRGIAGELYPCKPDVFVATYEPIGGEQDG